MDSAAVRFRCRTNVGASMELLRSNRIRWKPSSGDVGPDGGRLPRNVSIPLVHDRGRADDTCGSIAGRQLGSTLRGEGRCCVGGVRGELKLVVVGVGGTFGCVSDGHDDARMYRNGWHRSAMDMALWCVVVSCVCCRLSGGMGDRHVSEKLSDRWRRRLAPLGRKAGRLERPPSVMVVVVVVAVWRWSS